HVRIGVGFLETPAILSGHTICPRIEPLRPVQRDECDGVGHGVGDELQLHWSTNSISSGSLSMTASGSTSYDGTRLFGRNTARMPADLAPNTSSYGRSPTNTTAAGSSMPIALVAAAKAA